MPQKTKRKEQLNPGAMGMAILLVVAGIIITVLGIMNFEVLGFWVGILTIIGGVSTSAMAIIAIATGNQAWILLDLINPF